MNKNKTNIRTTFVLTLCFVFKIQFIVETIIFETVLR